MSNLITPRRCGVGAFLLFATACGQETRTASAKSPAPQQAGAPQSAAIAKAEFTVDTATVQLPIELAAQLYAEHDAVVVARSAGTIDSLFAELGDRVSSGQILARLESAEQEIALAGADAAYENLKLTMARSRTLTKSGGTTAADTEQVAFQLRQADVARRKARRDLDLTRITAPFAGLVTTRVARPSRFVAVGDTLFRVTEQAPLYARLRVGETSAQRLRVGDAATVVSASGEMNPATIVHSAPFVDAASGTREIVLQVARTHGELLAGSSVIVRVGRETRKVTSAPRAAIAREGYAIVVENGRTALRPVTVGRDIGGGRVEILSGLAIGERLARPTP